MRRVASSSSSLSRSLALTAAARAAAATRSSTSSSSSWRARCRYLTSTSASASNSNSGRGSNPAPAAAAASSVPHKKPVAATLATAYDPGAVEKGWYEWWESRGFFQPDADPSRPVYSMVIPPPNVTGALHIGHALNVTIQDILARWHRMRGFSVLWVPGLDHAGIATQVVVEKDIMRAQGLSRHALGRQRFIDAVWQWKDNYARRINSQLRQMGVSLDWSREVFTLDAPRSLAVDTAFIRLFESGLLYRSTRLVNWCPALSTALSDIEVDGLDVTGKTRVHVPGPAKTVDVGVMYNIAYPVEDGFGEEVVVATTRPETMFGDVAVAVHPDDKRYKHLIGRCLVQPVTNRRLPVIADAELVDPTTGTGAVKITPAHDAADFDCAVRYNARAASSNGSTKPLAFVSIMNDDGTLVKSDAPDASVPKAFQGLDRLFARGKVIGELKKLGFMRGTKDHPQRVGVCSRSGDIVEPRLKPQWYVRTRELAATALQLVESGRLPLLPGEQHVAAWKRWLGDTQDWCISRQLWWGHRVPAYRVLFDGENVQTTAAERWVVAHNEAEALARATGQYGSASRQIRVERDEDVLDTWFSSALFPMTVFGWPHPSEQQLQELQRFYPLSLMETGGDILFFWVARMVMLCTLLHPRADALKLNASATSSQLASAPPAASLADEEAKSASRNAALAPLRDISAVQLPFRQVFLHPIVRDKAGRKMSKSRGNVVDPSDVIFGATLDALKAKLNAATGLDPAELKTSLTALQRDHPKGLEACGADALRLTLASYLVQGRAINLNPSRAVASRAFANKLWQATRFAAGLFGSAGAETTSTPFSITPEEELAARQHQAMHTSLSALDFGTAATTVHEYVLFHLCDVYIEQCKWLIRHSDATIRRRTQTILFVALDSALRMLHPFMPFVTEELWQFLQQFRSSASSAAASSVMVSAYPAPRDFGHLASPTAQRDMQYVLDALHGFRSLKARFAAHVGAQPVPVIFCRSDASEAILQVHSELLKSLCGRTITSVVVRQQPNDQQEWQSVTKGMAISAGSELLSVGLKLLDSPALRSELTKQLEKANEAKAQADKLKAKLDSDTFYKVPANIQQSYREDYERALAEQKLLEHTAATLQAATSALASSAEQSK